MLSDVAEIPRLPSPVARSYSPRNAASSESGLPLTDKALDFCHPAWYAALRRASVIIRSGPTVLSFRKATSQPLS